MCVVIKMKIGALQCHFPFNAISQLSNLSFANVKRKENVHNVLTATYGNGEKRLPDESAGFNWPNVYLREAV